MSDKHTSHAPMSAPSAHRRHSDDHDHGHDHGHGAPESPSHARPVPDVLDLLRAPSTVRMVDLDPDATPGYPGKDKLDAPALTAELAPTLSGWQEKLYAENTQPDTPARNLLVVLQGMDTSGKGGIISHVFGLVDPQGLHVHAFKEPTPEELSHDFLWRIRNQVPGRGMIGIFDRSQYEDVLVVRVDELVGPEVWEQRFDQINDFEADLVASGTRIVKCFLNISPDVQERRLLERLNNPSKYWKYSTSDVKTRRRWHDYMGAYEDVLNRCNTEVAPWYVIPSNHKWYRNWAVATLLMEHLRQMAPQWPAPTFTVEDEIAAVKASLPEC
ncbi:MAG: polyphosphate kinase 2 family protein [Propionibacteriaceae bacterium]|nr:polyphosphate kinase 2 family protein [Propionibacteriaceae bacterium]